MIFIAGRDGATDAGAGPGDVRPGPHRGLQLSLHLNEVPSPGEDEHVVGKPSNEGKQGGHFFLFFFPTVTRY